MREGLIAIILVTVMLFNAVDVFVDISLDVPIWHVIHEASLVLISALGAAILFFHIRKKSQKLKRLADDLHDAKIQINNLNGRINDERKRYAGVIKMQFQEWGLTESEQQVALLLLKGLSLKEVSVVRNTKEATVRQQASTIYSKSNLVGRHEFAAWFLEDFLEADNAPQQVT